MRMCEVASPVTLLSPVETGTKQACDRERQEYKARKKRENRSSLSCCLGVCLPDELTNYRRHITGWMDHR